MLNKSLALLALGVALSAPSWADDEHAYGRVIRVEPSASFGYNDGQGQYRIQFELGGQRYWTQSDVYPGPWIEIPAQPHYAYPPRGERSYGREEHHWWRHHDDDDD